MNKITMIFSALLIAASTSSLASEEYQHFPSLKAENTQVALCNLASFNEKLTKIVNKKTLSPEDMVKVHELTYTLENAVQRLQTDLADIAVNLERVHLASEHLKQATIKEAGDKYLNATALIVQPSACQIQ